MKTIFKKPLSKLVLCTMVFAMLCTMFSIPAFADDTPVTTLSGLTSAISNAGDGDTIYLGADINLGTTSLTIANNVTIDGDGKYGFTYSTTDASDTAKNRSAIIVADGNYTVTLQNLSVTATGGNAVHVYANTQTVNVTIDNCILTATYPLYVGYGKDRQCSYYQNLTVKNSTLNAVSAILAIETARVSTSFTYEVPGTVSITESVLSTEANLLDFAPESGYSRGYGFQDITIEKCTIDMPDSANAIITRSDATVTTAGTGLFYAELKMDESTLEQIPGVAYALGANGGLVANIYDLAEFEDGGYGSGSTNAYSAYTKTLQLADDIELSDDVELWFDASSSSACNNVVFDLNGHILTLTDGAVITFKGNNSGKLEIIDSSEDNSGGIATDAEFITYTPQIAVTNTINGTATIDVDVLDEYAGVVVTGIATNVDPYYFVLIGDNTEDVATVNYSGTYSSGAVGRTYAIFSPVDEAPMTYVEDGYKISDVIFNDYISFTEIAVAFTNLPEGFSVQNSSGASWTFTVDGESITLENGDTYTVPVPTLDSTISDITLASQSITLTDGEGSLALDPTVTDSASSDQDLTQFIVWSIKYEGDTGAALEGSTLTVTGAGKAIITATVADGLGDGIDYIKHFIIDITEGSSSTGDGGSTGETTAATVNVSSIVLNDGGDVTLTTDETLTIGTDISVTIEPSDFSASDIAWTVYSDGGTGMGIDADNKITATAAGRAIIRATVTDGLGSGTDYVKQFIVTVTATATTVALDPITNLTLSTATFTAGGSLDLSGAVVITPDTIAAADAGIVWTVKSAGSTGMTISGSTVTATSAGTAIVTATATGRGTNGSDYVKNFIVKVTG